MSDHDALLHSIFGDDIILKHGKPQIADEKVLRSDRMDRLVRAAVFGETQERERARWLIWQIGQAVGVRPASIHELYMARGRGEGGGFTDGGVFAILLFNIANPLLDKMRPRALGRSK